MANVKHIFSGAGDPNQQGLNTTEGIHHYLDEESGDLWLGDAVGGWSLIYQGGSEGNIAFYYTESSVPQLEPGGPAICEAGAGFFIRSHDGNWNQLELYIPQK